MTRELPPIFEGMEPERLFLETLTDLERRVNPADREYDVLMAAALLRKLLLDAQPVADQVNRRWRLKIRYRINAREPLWKRVGGLPSPDTWSMEDGFDPESALAGVQPQEVTRDGLLARVIMRHKGEDVTVKDLILHAANVKGAVHLGVPKTAKEKALSDLASSISIGGYGAGIRALQAIGRVVLKGLDPLRRRIENDLVVGGTD
jgi:hypothetical protein